jgi:flagellar motor switch protein FliN/FliY
MSISGSTAADLPPIDDGGIAVPGGGRSLEALMDVSLPVVIEIGRTQMTVQEVLQLAPGSVVEIDRTVGEPVDIYVGDRRFAQGEVVVVGEEFGVRITRVLSTPGTESTT